MSVVTVSIYSVAYATLKGAFIIGIIFPAMVHSEKLRLSPSGPEISTGVTVHALDLGSFPHHIVL